MMEEEISYDEDILHKLLVGEIGPDSIEGQRVLADPALAEAFAQLTGLASQLDSVADDVVQPTDAVVVDRTLGALWAHDSDSSANSSPRLALVGGILAFAASLTLLAVLLFDRGEEEGAPVLGNETTITLLAPVIQGESWGTFRWKTEISPGLRFVVTIQDAETEVTIVDERTDESFWKPKETATWPESIRWKVSAFLPGVSDPENETDWVTVRR